MTAGGGTDDDRGPSVGAQGPLYIGIDVGTGSARAALLDDAGVVLAEASRPTRTWHPSERGDARFFEQSTDDIWSAVCACVRDVVRQESSRRSAASASVARRVRGLGFDATCSLAVVDGETGEPIGVSPDAVVEGHDGSKPGAEAAAAAPKTVPPFSVGAKRNVILWADHRAEQEAAQINATRHMVLDFVGGTMSLEMEIPKVLWLKKHMPAETFARCHFYDLPDYLTYRATDCRARSHCSLVCKCSYVPPGVAAGAGDLGWQPDFFRQVGLDQLVRDDFRQLGGVPGRGGLVLTAGQPVGRGLSRRAAEELGLPVGTPVGSGLIDAYAGWVGTVAASSPNAPDHALEATKRTASGPSRGPKPSEVHSDETQPGLASSRHRLAAIAGTSTCHCVQSPEGVSVPGVWGPYKNAVFPGMWMNEGGQSSTGQLIDFVISTHPAYAEAQAIARRQDAAAGGSGGGGGGVFGVLHRTLDEMVAAAQKQRDAEQASHVDAGTDSAPHSSNSPSPLRITPSHLTKHLLLYPDFHGNRSPLADPGMTGVVSGLKLDRSLSDLALRYYATLEAIALQTRHIVDEMNARGHDIRVLYMSGGHVKNAAFMQLMADATRLPVQLPSSSSASVVMGSAILGRFAADVADSLVAPSSSAPAAAHEADGASRRGVIESQEQADRLASEHRERLWQLMSTMTRPGALLHPTTTTAHADAPLSSSEPPRRTEADPPLARLLEAKYRNFLDAVEVQRRWRARVDEALRF